MALCKDCGKELSLEQVGRPCPDCGFSNRSQLVQDQGIGIDEIVSVREHWKWDSLALALVGVVYGIVVTVGGVLLATSRLPWLLAYGVISLGGLALILYRKDVVIPRLRRYLQWKGPGRKIYPP